MLYKKLLSYFAPRSHYFAIALFFQIPKDSFLRELMKSDSPENLIDLHLSYKRKGLSSIYLNNDPTWIYPYLLGEGGHNSKENA